jgi:hypothetical protein
MMFVASHKHENLKGLISQGVPLLLQDVLGEGACVMVPNQSSSGFSSVLVASTTSSSFFMQASLTALTRSGLCFWSHIS